MGSCCDQLDGERYPLQRGHKPGEIWVAVERSLSDAAEQFGVEGWSQMLDGMDQRPGRARYPVSSPERGEERHAWDGRKLGDGVFRGAALRRRLPRGFKIVEDDEPVAFPKEHQRPFEAGRRIGADGARDGVLRRDSGLGGFELHEPAAGLPEAANDLGVAAHRFGQRGLAETGAALDQDGPPRFRGQQDPDDRCNVLVAAEEMLRRRRDGTAGVARRGAVPSSSQIKAPAVKRRVLAEQYPLDARNVTGADFSGSPVPGVFSAHIFVRAPPRYGGPKVLVVPSFARPIRAPVRPRPKIQVPIQEPSEVSAARVRGKISALFRSFQRRHRDFRANVVPGEPFDPHEREAQMAAVTQFAVCLAHCNLHPCLYAALALPFFCKALIVLRERRTPRPRKRRKSPPSDEPKRPAWTRQC